MLKVPGELQPERAWPLCPLERQQRILIADPQIAAFVWHVLDE